MEGLGWLKGKSAQPTTREIQGGFHVLSQLAARLSRACVARGASRSIPLPRGEAMERVDCPFCSQLGTIISERVIQARAAALTTYLCRACQAEWDERRDERQVSPRKRDQGMRNAPST